MSINVYKTVSHLFDSLSSYKKKKHKNLITMCFATRAFCDKCMYQTYPKIENT